MAIPQSSLIIKRYDGFAPSGGGIIDAEYLGAAYETGKPYVFENQITKIFSSYSQMFKGKLFNSMLNGKSATTMEIDNEVFRWRLQGAEEKRARSIELVEDSSYPGLNNTAIKLKLDLDYYAYPDVLFGEDPEYPLEIVDGPVADGTGFIYTVRIQGDNPFVFLPSGFLDIGKEFNKVWTSIPSQLNSKDGTQQYPNSFLLENQVGAFAQGYSVSDKAWRDEGKLDVQFMFTDRNGKSQVAKRFLPMAEAKMWDELYQSMEAQYVYGKRQTRPAPASNGGYWTKTGSGLREQLKDSWLKYYNGPLVISTLKDYLLDIFITRKNETERKTTLVTGSLGATQFHDALVAISNGYLTVDSHFISDIPSNGSPTPHLAYGAEFRRYRGPLGITVDLTLNGMYDDNNYCRRTHPLYPNYPIDSARMTFLDFGATLGGKNNIMILKVKDTFSWGYVPGTWSPTGPVKGGVAGSKLAGYEVFTRGTGGLHIEDVTRCGEYIYDFEY